MVKIEQNKILTSARGRALLENPLLNKSTAFSEQERLALGLEGLLPDRIEDLDTQCQRALNSFDDEPDGLLRHINLRVLQDTNETLFYAILQRHLKKLLPYIYTPVVGEACQLFSTIFRRPRGLFISWPNRHRMSQMLDNCGHRPEVIVVTDGDRILGLGDLGMNGLGICIGKLSLYSGVGGFEPANTLPVVLDAGTDNEDMLYGQNYLGWRHKRLDDEKYFEFVDQFMQEVKNKWPEVILQFEDFSAAHAIPLLQKWRTGLCCFNDDIQGTAAVVAGSLLSAANRAGQGFKELKIVIAGAGAAGCGIAEQLVRLFRRHGYSGEEINNHLYLVDKGGLLVDDLEGITSFQMPFAQLKAKVSDWANEDGIIDLETVVRKVEPHALIGVTGVSGLFNEEVVRHMAACHEHPIIFPLSNPGQKSEVLPAQMVAWTEGRVLMATGSPFETIAYRNKLYPVAQCNNIYIFPALGLGVRICGASVITDGMLDVCVVKLAECAPVGVDATTPILPFMESIEESVEAIALAVAEKAVEEGVSSEAFTLDQLQERLSSSRWSPQYKDIEPIECGVD